MGLRVIFALLLFSFIFSCRNVPENEKVDTSNIALVGINATGIEYEKSPISANADEQGVSAWGGVIV